MSKRVLVFTETALALSETFIAAHCRALERYQYTLVALHGSGEHHRDVARRLLFERRPAPWSRLAFRVGLSRRLDQLIGTMRPDIIHAHYLTNGAFLQPYATRHDIPLVVTAHGHDATRRLRPGSIYDQVYRLQRRRLQSEAAMILPVSHFLRDKLLAAGFSPQRTRTHYLGIALTGAPPVDIASKPPRIVFVGRLVAKKGIDTVLDAFALVRSTRPDAELHIVGDGPLRALVDARSGAIGAVTVHGAQSPERTRQLIATARLLTLPSRQAHDGDVEGFGLVLIEAQAMGIPVVTSGASGTREAILAGKTGFAVDPASSADLAKAMLKLLDEPGLAAAMGANAYRFVRGHFDLAHQTRALERIYDAVLQSAGVPKPGP